MNLSRLMPLMVMAAIGYHGKAAIERRLALFSHSFQSTITEHNMRIILRAAVYESIAGGVHISDFPSFARRSMERHLSGDDPARDSWGSLLQHREVGRTFSVLSAGPDRRWNTADDIVVSAPLSDLSESSRE